MAMTREQFQLFHPNRRLGFTYPLHVDSHSQASINVTITVLDAPVNRPSSSPCVAMIVPDDMDRDWMYCTEGGQWQLVTCADTRRLILISWNRPSKQRTIDSAELKEKIAPLLMALSPSVCVTKEFHVPFVVYSDDTLYSRVVSQSVSMTSGLGVLVEDVILPATDPAVNVSLRRRLRFESTPNLIQSEVELILPGQQKRTHDSALLISALKAGTIVTRVNTSVLVHKYLPYVVAGLNLIPSCFSQGSKPKALLLGGGAFSLPIFLSTKLKFNVLAVEIDATVVAMAKRHFGLQESTSLKVHVDDGAQYVQNCSSRGSRGAKRDFFDLLVVDIDSSDGRMELSSPPPAFTSSHFLKNVRRILNPIHGMLAVNVVPNTEEAFEHLTSDLKKVFQQVMEVSVAGDVNKVLFCMRGSLGFNPGSELPPLLLQYKHLLDDMKIR